MNTFLLEALSPFESAPRGFRGTCAQLRQLDGVLERKDGELASLKVKLAQETVERERIQRRSDHWEAIVNASRESLTLIDRHYRYEAANDAYCRAHGLKREQILGRRISELWGQKVFASAIRGALNRCFRGEEVCYQAWFRFRAGKLRYYDVNCHPYCQGGVVTHAIVGTRDITEVRQARDALRDSGVKFHALVESAHDGIITADRKGRIVFVNGGGERLFGYRREELLAKPFAVLIAKRRRAGLRQRLRRLLAAGESSPQEPVFETRGLRRDGGEFPVEVAVATWRTQQGVFHTGIVRDITEPKQAEVALRKSKQHYFQLFQQARAVEKSLHELTGKVLLAQEEERKRISRELHDEIGSALTAANVSIALLRRHAGADCGFQRRLTAAQKLLSQSMEAVHRFARELRPDMLDQLGLCAALRSWVRTFGRRTGIAVRLRMNAALDRLGTPPATALYRVVQESLTNVFKHARATRAAVEFQRIPQGLSLEVRDNGCSFRVAGPRAGPRSGRLGLRGMEERVRLINGEFAIESVRGRGTTVRVKIPLDFPSAGHAGEAPARRVTAKSTGVSHEKNHHHSR